MGIINILDTQTANMIAAGEVVEKPASAVKEMIENSIDAGATHITCEIKNGGNSFIRISDNGKGISGDDLPKTILPHATSKILTADDLDGVLTLGFRGEALAAISSVSRLQILSKQKDSPIGNKLISDENGVEITEEGAPDGTVIIVKDLFYNVPARRKFMRKDSSEASAVTNVLIKAALSHPEISFKLISDETTKFITPGDGDLYSAIYATLGRDFAKALTTVAGIHGDISVGGYISNHGESRGSRSGQYFFVNNRAIQSTQIMAALEQAFKSYMPPKRFPAAVLKIEVPPKFVDVNVHPAKTEIKFADDRKIFEAVYSAVLSSLKMENTDVEFVQEKKEFESAKNNLSQEKSDVKPNSYTEANTLQDSKKTESIDSATIHKPSVLLSESKTPKRSFLDFKENKPVGNYIILRDPNIQLGQSFEERVKQAEKEKNEDVSLPLNSTIIAESDKLSKGTKLYYTSAVSPKEENKLSENEIKFAQPEIVQMEYDTKKELPKFKVIGEAFGGYIVAETEAALLLIDKHAAHERILYEDLAEKRGDSQIQYLLSPHVIRLGALATDLVIENKELLLSYGFEIDSFGNDSIAVRAVPSTLSNISGIEALLDEFADTLSKGDRLSFSKRCDRALYTLACKAAIKLGPPSQNEELSFLVEKLLSDPKLKLCPHGRPIVKEISKRDIEKFFDR